MKSVSVLAGLVFLGSFAGALHPLGDSLAVFRMPIAAGFALCVIWTDWPRRVRWPLVALPLAAMAWIVALKFVPQEPGPLVVYQKNLLFKNAQVAAVAEDILMRRPDVVTLQEVSDSNRELLALLRADYPYQVFCPFTGWSGMAVLSRIAASDSLCSDSRGLAALRVPVGGTEVWIASIHLHWPWPYGQGAHVTTLLPILSALDGPVVLSGDFNMVPWSHTMRVLTDVTATRRAGPLAPTLVIRHVPLPIDHVLAPGGGTAEVLPRLGSDHNGVLARVWVDAR